MTRPDDILDDRLRLIFTCCHPALALEAQVALTLRTLCGLETDEIARVFLVPASTMAQRACPRETQDPRRDARFNEAGDIVLLEDQDRSRWNHAQIAEALPLVAEAWAARAGPFALQAAIAAVHCRARRAEDTDWREIARLYDLLERVQPSPVVSLNRAVAVAMVEGPGPALAIIDKLAAQGDLSRYHLLHATVLASRPKRQKTTASSRVGEERQRTPIPRATPARSSSKQHPLKQIQECL